MPNRICDNCDRSLTGGGPTSESGVYYCSRPDCQAAKQRAWYKSRQVAAKPEAPTVCAGCGDDLKPRKVRHGDSPLGRWCNKPACRRHKDATHRRAGMQMASPEHVKRIFDSVEFLRHAAAFDRVVCPNCSVEDAVQGYPHPDPYGEKCRGTGERWMSLTDAAAVWRDRAYDPSGTLVPHND